MIGLIGNCRLIKPVSKQLNPLTQPNYMNKLILSAIILAASSLIAANADTIIQTVNFDAPGGLGGPNYAGPGADTGGVTNEYWNPIAFDGTTAAGLASDGSTHTGITFTDTSTDFVTGGGPTAIPLYTPFLRAIGVADTETLSNVPAGLYNLFIYSQNGGFAGRGAILTLGASSQTVSNFPSGDQPSFVYGVNYIEFTGISLVTAGSLSFTYSPYPVEFTEGDLNGVQLQSLSVPEPSTWAMLIGGVGMLLVVQRLRRKLSV
jgi:hypothetical protein